MTTRRYAAHAVKRGELRFEPGVVEVEQGRVVAAYPLQGEQAATLWVGGTITVEAGSQGEPVARHNGKTLT